MFNVRLYGCIPSDSNECLEFGTQATRNIRVELNAECMYSDSANERLRSDQWRRSGGMHANNRETVNSDPKARHKCIAMNGPTRVQAQYGQY